ncbi:MAG: quinoprotein dehydrogenase-associated putative ABC transporter substrate-binding protein, partial [Burkholderiaceae bacterium]
DKEQRGFENKIADLFAKKLGWKLEHTWYPQRMGFIRNTLKAKIPDTDRYKCDLVTGVASGFDMGLATVPYYHSTYALAYVKGRGLDDVHTPEDLVKLDPAKRAKLRIGAFMPTPAIDWLLKNGLINQMVPYQVQTGDPAQYPGQIIENDLASGKLDVAIAWGPIVGYFAKHTPGAEIAVVPFQPGDPQIHTDFDIAMGVRYGEKDFRDRINQLIKDNRPEIDAILAEYGVPTMPVKADK